MGSELHYGLQRGALCAVDTIQRAVFRERTGSCLRTPWMRQIVWRSTQVSCVHPLLHLLLPVDKTNDLANRSTAFVASMAK
uniref:Polyketide synthase n=1 Tax=Peronospora matthiolae TaxID=2874970 RepID=A0AAV1TTA6_9STRA